jgi:folate-dependent tRNA-U54 methylase TrmFO/GidA
VDDRRDGVEEGEGFGAGEAADRLGESHPLVRIVREEVDGLPPEEWGSVIVATGPLTAPGAYCSRSSGQLM